jgi:hypothetical protein
MWDTNDEGHNFNFLLLACIGGAKLSTTNVRTKAEEVSSKPQTKSEKQETILGAMNNLILRWYPSLDGSHLVLLYNDPSPMRIVSSKNALGVYLPINLSPCCSKAEGCSQQTAPVWYAGDFSVFLLVSR